MKRSYTECQSIVTTTIFEALSEGAHVSADKLKEEVEKRMEGEENSDIFYAKEILKGMLCRLTLNGTIVQSYKSPSDVTYWLAHQPT